MPFSKSIFSFIMNYVVTLCISMSAYFITIPSIFIIALFAPQLFLDLLDYNHDVMKVILIITVTLVYLWDFNRHKIKIHPLLWIVPILGIYLYTLVISAIHPNFFEYFLLLPVIPSMWKTVVELKK